MIRSRNAGLSVLLLALVDALAPAADWIRQGVNTNQPVWGARGGLLFAIHPAGFGGHEGGPRGLIRVGYPTLPGGGYDLINFIAVEPIVKGLRGFSELERSELDGRAGKRLWTESSAGSLTTVAGAEILEVIVRVERFENGTQVRLKLRQSIDAPGELRIIAEAEPGSAAPDSCILTATMGNKARTRKLWLRGGPVSSVDLYRDHSGGGFAPHRMFPLNQLARTADGDVRVCLSTDEEAPAEVQPFGRPHFWDYRGRRVTQYWRKPSLTIGEDLVCAVNARSTSYGLESSDSRRCCL